MIDSGQFAGVELFRLAIDAGRNAVFVEGLLYFNREAGTFHIEFVQLLFHSDGEFCGSFAPSLREFLSNTANLLSQLVILLLVFNDQFIAMNDAVEFGLVFVGTFKNILNGWAVLPFQPRDEIKSFFDLGQPLWIVLDLGLVATDAGSDIFEVIDGL